MHLKAIVIAAILPFLAAADDDVYSTTTMTSTYTATQTITLQRVSTYSYYDHANTTATYKPVGTDYTTKAGPTPTKAVTVPTSGANLVSGSGAALLGFAGVAMAALL